jgi:hypothetical protein
MIMWHGRACDVCGLLTRELVAIMSDHLNAEKQLAEAMFVTQQFEVARNANAQALFLLEKRHDLIQRFETHRLAAHDDITLDDPLVSSVKHPRDARELSEISTGFSTT